MKKRKIVSLILVFCLTIGVLLSGQVNMASALSNTYQTVDAGIGFNLAIKADGTLWTWGVNDYGQLGDGTYIDKSIPVKIMDNVASVKAGLFKSYAIKTDGTLWAWGRNVSVNVMDSNTPIQILDHVASISTFNDSYEFAIKTDGTLWAIWYVPWDYFNQYDYRMKPTQVLENVASVTINNQCIYILKTDDSLWAWGKNEEGIIGDGTNITKSKPVAIMENVASVTFKNGTSYAIKKDGTLWTWGVNDGLQIGEAMVANSNRPVQILDQTASVTVGHYCTYAIKTDGTLWVWGDNRIGQYGDGTTIAKSKPVKIIDKVVSVEALDVNGNYNIFVTRTDDTLWGWGTNYYGELADGTRELKYTPVKLMDNVADVKTGVNCVIATKEDASLWIWGLFFYDQIAGFNYTYADGFNKRVSVAEPFQVMDHVAIQNISVVEQTPIGNTQPVKISNYNVPLSRFYQNADVFNCSGKLNSLEDMPMVYVEILDSYGEIEKQATAFPKSKEFNLANLAKEFQLDKLSRGDKKYRIKAVVKNKTYTLVEYKFTVKKNTMAQYFTQKNTDYSKALAIKSADLMFRISTSDSSVDSFYKDYGFGTPFHAPKGETGTTVNYSSATCDVKINGVEKTILAIVFQGTRGNIEKFSPEWKGDAGVGFGEVHRNFLETEQIVSKEFSNKYKDKLKDPSKVIIWITGHSRGAAVAGIMAKEYSDKKYTVYAYTFASPQYAKKNTYTKGNIINLVDKNDPVPQLVLNYKRYGVDRFFGSGNLIDPFLHMPSNYYDYVCK